MDGLALGTLDLATLRDFAIALFIGALIGVERERKLEEHPQEFGGLRTFILIALAGALSAFLSKQFDTPWLYIAGLLSLTGLVAVAYQAEVQATKTLSGLTGEVAAIVTWLLAGAVVVGHREIAVMLAIVTTALLTFKQDLHKVVRGLARDDVVAGLQLLFASFIVLPLLPDRPLDPWGALNPYKLWLLVVLISGLSLVGYAAVRILGERMGMTLTGLFGGLVSSTAVTLAFSRQSKVSGSPESLAFGVLVAWTVMLVRVVVVTGIVHWPLALELLPPVAAMLVASLVYLFVLWRRTRAAEAHEGPAVEFKNPFSLLAAVKFGLLFAAVLLIVALARLYLPSTWLYPIAAVAGATDVDPIALTMAQQAREALPITVAATAVLISMFSNTVVKAAMVVVLGTRPLAKVVLLGAGIVGVSGLVAAVIAFLL